MELSFAVMEDLVKVGVDRVIDVLFGRSPAFTMKLRMEEMAQIIGDKLAQAIKPPHRSFSDCVPYRRGDAVEVVPLSKATPGATGTLVSFSEHHIEVLIPAIGPHKAQQVTIPMSNVAEIIRKVN